VTRRVGDDELAAGGREVAIGDVDRDPLLALGDQPVEQEREVELVALGAETLRIAGERRQVVVEDEICLVQEASDQRALAVVDTAAGDEPQQPLPPLRLEESVDLGRSDQK
jgi:hypothetical protein